MSDDNSTNGQIIDSVGSVVTLLTAQAPSQSFGMLDAVLLETLGMALHNAVNRQQGASLISSAAVTAACSKMLGVPFPIAPMPPPAVPPQSINLLPGPVPNTPPTAALIAAALAEGETAINTLKAQAQGAAADVSSAQSNLRQLANDAAPAAVAAMTAEGDASNANPAPTTHSS